MLITADRKSRRLLKIKIKDFEMKKSSRINFQSRIWYWVSRMQSLNPEKKPDLLRKCESKKNIPCRYYLLYTKYIKLVELSRFAHPYDFHAWSDGVHDFAKTSYLTQKLKICSLSILYWLSVDGAFYFFSFFATRKQLLNFYFLIKRKYCLLQFLVPNYMLWLLIIIKQSIILTKSSVNRKTPVLRINVRNFKSIR